VPTLTAGIIAPKKNKTARRPDSPGFVADMLGELYLVKHEGAGPEGVYTEEELQPELRAYWKVSHHIKGILYSKEIATHEGVAEYLRELGGVEATTEGPFYEDKILVEGPQVTRDLFDHLTNEPD
jgi:hypothetical protein